MKRHLSLLTLALTMTAAAAWADAPTDSTHIFIYSPDAKAGLHVARQSSDGSWQHLGQLCASDYGPWGSGKRMLSPSVVQASDGSWRLVFQLDEQSPAFGAAYSADLITWRPQDYPIVGQRGVKEPVVRENSDGSFAVYYNSAQGQRRVTATPDFRHFSADEPAQEGQQLWLRDTATVDGKRFDGTLCHVPVGIADGLSRHFAQLARDAELSAERMYDDPQRFSSMKSPLFATLRVDMDRQKPISDKLIGIFFEDISYAADGGLYAELVQNRDFEYSSKDQRGWNAKTAWSSNGPINIINVDPLSPNNPNYVVVTSDSLINEGWDGIAVEQGKKYDFSMFVARPSASDGSSGSVSGVANAATKRFLIALLAPDGSVVASTKMKVKAASWQQFSCVLTATKTEAKARLLVLPLGKEEVCLDMISLFPQETFMGRKNGLRKDLAETIARLKPKFVRFPGGCMSHGQGLDNIYHWSETVGPLWERRPDMNIWHYHQTRGLGFYEYFQFCEDIGAEPLPVLAAGVPCQNSGFNSKTGVAGQQGGIPMADMPAYVQELLDLIEWANGDPATSKWAKMRADAGHPAPFNLKYIGIGNEDIISTVFEERYEMICRAIRERYPDIKICGTVGPFHTPSADYIEGWDFTRKHPDLQFMTDEHYYESTGWFLHHRDYYDQYPRTLADAGSVSSDAIARPATKVYLGEWAASTKVKRPNVETALAEALYLTDIERNGDVVHMTSYAPMLCKDGHSNWNPDMIYFSNTTVRPTLAYDVQRLFSNYSGDRWVFSEFSALSETSEHSDSSETSRLSALKYRLGASVVRDSKTGKTYVKLVNALPVSLNLSVEGLSLLGARGEGFTGKPEDQKAACIPLQLGDRITLPPYSLSVVEL